MKSQYRPMTILDQLFNDSKFEFASPAQSSHIRPYFYVKLTWNVPLQPGTLWVTLDNKEVTDQFLDIDYEKNTADTFLSVSPGEHTLTVRGYLANVLSKLINLGYKEKTTTITFTTQDFDFQLNPTLLKLDPGQSRTVSVNTTRLGGLSKKIHVFASRPPQGITCIPLDLENTDPSGMLTITADETAQSSLMQIAGATQLDDGGYYRDHMLNISINPFPTGGLGGGQPWIEGRRISSILMI